MKKVATGSKMFSIPILFLGGGGGGSQRKVNCLYWKHDVLKEVKRGYMHLKPLH